MNNFEKIKNMTLDEMAEFLLDVYYQAETIVNFGRTEYIKQWLQQECEGQDDRLFTKALCPNL